MTYRTIKEQLRAKDDVIVSYLAWREAIESNSPDSKAFWDNYRDRVVYFEGYEPPDIAY